jgi:hypothetical protein
MSYCSITINIIWATAEAKWMTSTHAGLGFGELLLPHLIIYYSLLLGSNTCN